MKLVEVLARELKGWPIDFQHALLTQSVGGRVSYVVNNKERWTAGNGFTRADDWAGAIVSRTEWIAAVEALDKPEVATWNGEDMPPIGTECEARFPEDSQPAWETVEILYAGIKFIAMRFADGDVVETETKACELRPIQTQEQVEAERRQVGIEDLAKQLQSNTECPSTYVWELAQKTYDLGYRKPE